MRDEVRFLLGREPRVLRTISPTMTVLEYLRTVEKLCGTKEGCAEGDCGACTVVLAEPDGDGDGTRYRAVNACIMFAPALDGKQLLTVEHPRGAGGEPHPAPAAMVEHHASQCGYRTPGFVMSLFALHHGRSPVDRARMNDALAGNLCRCTAYRPIVDAALSMGLGQPAAALPRAQDTDARLELHHDGQTWIAPRTVAELSEVLLSYPDAILLAGGTDVGLWVTKQHRLLETIVTLDAVRDMAATPVRVAAAERALIGKAWTEANVGAAMDVAGLHAALGPGHDGGTRLGRGGAGDVLRVAAVLAADRRVVLRRADVFVALRAGSGRGGAVGAALGVALYRHGRGVGADLSGRASHQVAPAGDARAAVSGAGMMCVRPGRNLSSGVW
jgi:xanthine dehydrogenase small subunit